MFSVNKIIGIIILIIIQFLIPIYGQTQQQSCVSSEASQFDFWIGTWELSWVGPSGGLPEGQKGTAVNIIEKTMGNCVIVENFSFADSSFIGKSWSVYNPTKKVWQQTWVDNSGSYLLFSGGMEDDKMILKTAPFDQNGKTYISRMVFREITDNSLNWDWQRSDDNGKTWTNLWNINYKKVL